MHDNCWQGKKAMPGKQIQAYCQLDKPSRKQMWHMRRDSGHKSRVQGVLGFQADTCEQIQHDRGHGLKTAKQ
jgi:hypothetical protein